MHPAAAPKREGRSALIAAFAAFATSRLIPVYWKLPQAVPAAEIIAHRFIWTTLFLIVLLTCQRRWPELRHNARSRLAVR